MSDLIKRIDGAIERITTGSAPMRVPVHETDPDMVLFDCKKALEANAALIALLRASLRKVEDEVEGMKSDVSIKAALMAWFDPNHPDQGDFAARMRLAIDAALVKSSTRAVGSDISSGEGM